MRVVVTGATGLLGSHTAACLHACGHEVRAFVRSPEKAAEVLGRLGATGIECVAGDVTERRAVQRALAGAEAVVHAAALPSLDPSQRRRVHRTNVLGAATVLRTACELGLDPVIHVSSVAALFPPSERMLRSEDEVKRPRETYAASKAAAERIARRLQRERRPVVIFYPGQIWAPFDPSLAQGVRYIVRALAQAVVYDTPGGTPMIDARDLASAIAAALVPGQGPRRFMAGGHFLTFRRIARMLEQLTGRELRTPYVPQALVLGHAWLADRFRGFLGASPEATWEAGITMTRGVPTDDRRLRDELGVELRPPEETLRDMLRWMAEAGVIAREAIGRLRTGGST